MISHSARAILCASVVTWLAPAQAQVPKTAAPATKAAVGPFDVTIVKRAEALLTSPARWNRNDSGSCPRADTTYSVRCALRRAIVEAAGLSWRPAPAVAQASSSTAHVECAMDVSADHRDGSCGTLWDELPVFTLSRVAKVASGVWRKDAQPSEVWTGTMADAENPVTYEARHGVDMVAHRQSSDQLIAFNNDSTTTFDDVRKFFSSLEARVLQNGATDLGRAADDVEIEIYDGGRGVIRTYNGWFAVSDFSVRGSAMHFAIDTAAEVAPNAVDREILVRAAQILSSDSVWNRADDRKCPASATKWSIYCAVEKAQIDVAGGFHHRRPAGELVRTIVDERTKSRNYNHRMMDYNNDPTTKLSDVQSLFAEAIARIRRFNPDRD